MKEPVVFGVFDRESEVTIVPPTYLLNCDFLVHSFGNRRIPDAQTATIGTV